MRLPDGVLEEVERSHAYPRAFITVSGAHLYGFPSQDSDYDLRGVHLLPLEQIVGLRGIEETITWIRPGGGVEVDLVTHELAKFCRLLLTRNGYVLEQLLSPLVVTASPLHEELVALAPSLMTKNHAHHYLGFARNQWRLFEKSGELKPLLYTFRVLLTGIRLMRTGELEAGLTRLDGGPSYLPELIELKQSAEHAKAPVSGSYGPDVVALTEELEQAYAESSLPLEPHAHDALHDLVVRARLGR